MVFDDLFPNGKVKELIIAEVKSGSSRMGEAEKRVKKAVDNGEVRFELIQVE